jgi:hypothetical protein
MSFSTFKGKYVFHLFPYWKETPTESISHAIEEWGQLGMTVAEEVESYPRFYANHSYLFRNKTAIGEMNDFFDNHLGRLSAMWFPSFKEDIILTDGIGSGDANLDIQDIEYSTFNPVTPGTGRYIFIYVNSNKWFARKITGVPSSTLITMESSLGEALSLSQIKLVSFLYLGRSDIDETDCLYPTPDVGIMQLFFVELPNEYADLP